MIILSAIFLTLLNAFIVTKESRLAAVTSAEALFQEIISRTINRIDLFLEPISTIALTSTLILKGNAARGEEFLYTQLSYIKDILVANTDIISAYIGYSNGHFYQVFAVRDNKLILETYRAPPGTKYIDRAITGSDNTARTQRWRFFDDNIKLLSQRIEQNFKYDPRVRPWYEAALKHKDTVFTSPYIFSSSRLPGITCARLLKDGGGVFGIDLSLNQLSEILSNQKVSAHGLLWVIDKNNRLVSAPGLTISKQATEDLSLPDTGKHPNDVIRAVSERISDKTINATLGEFFLEVNQERYMVFLTPASQKGLDLFIAVAAPFTDITSHIRDMAVRSLISSFGALVVIVLLTVLISKRLSLMLSHIVKEADKIKNFDFSQSLPIESKIKEFKDLIGAMDLMKATIQSKTDSLIDTKRKLQRLVEGGIAVSSEKNTAKLITIIMDISKELSGANGRVLYLMEGDVLEVELLSLKSGTLVLGGLSDNPTPRIMLNPQMMPFLDKASALYWACRAYNDRTLVSTCHTEIALFPTGLAEEPKDYKIDALIAVPLITAQGNVLGVIQLFNPIEKNSLEFITGYHTEVLSFVNSLAAQAAISIDNRNLLKSLREIFDALIQVIASSIDAKSSYTGGHCSRVPDLAMMIAQAVHESDAEPLKEFRLQGEEQKRQLMIAAWFHDCGKVAIPEYVVDKATKLETIYNRIHEIRMRFEVLRRDAEIRYYQGLLEPEANPERLKVQLESEIKRLEDDFDFVAKCNVGGEFMSESDRDRIREIGKKTWTRYFSSRAGISEDELIRKGDESEESLPVAENLLADKTEHIIRRNKPPEKLMDVYGNPINIPENEFNRGEIYNLCIPKGTLTEEDRYKINEHAIMSFQMLSKVPFPEGLKMVPEIASSHHETLVGTGYPFKKDKGYLSIESRILAIADIFEALTASDRPYKKAKPLSEALKIMTFMRKDKHIDPDVFEVFLRSGVYRNYAEKYLLPTQIDVVDARQYFGKEQLKRRDIYANGSME